MRLSGTRNMNGFLARTCLLGITVLKYDLIASSSCSVKFNATQYQLWKCTFRLYNNHFTLMELNLFSDVLRLRAYIYIYIFQRFEFSKRSKQRFSRTKQKAACLLKAAHRFITRRENTRRYRFSCLILLHPNAFRWTVFARRNEIFESYFCQTEIKL